MAILFLSVVGVVTLITIHWPQNLYEQVKRDMRSTKEMSEFFQSRAFREIVRRMVLDILREHKVIGSEPGIRKTDEPA